jgi:hypothetical protein
MSAGMPLKKIWKPTPYLSFSFLPGQQKVSSFTYCILFAKMHCLAIDQKATWPSNLAVKP